jgi:hypothetical protein
MDLLKGLRTHLRTGLPYNFVKKAAPPIHTPDLVKLQQQEFNLVFDWDNRVRKAPCAFPGSPIFSDQTFLMYLQNHEDGTPGLVFNHQMHRGFPGQPRAKLKGKLHPCTAEQMLELDGLCGNRVQSLRKRVRVLLADRFTFQHQTNVCYGHPVRVNAWMYFNNDRYWESKFQYDLQHFRGHTKESLYLPCPHVIDERPYVKRFYQPYSRIGFEPTLVQRQFDYRRYRTELLSEEESWLEKQEEKKYVILHEQSNKPKASVS